jgi:hypothetical protein
MRLAALLVFCLFVAACAGGRQPYYVPYVDPHTLTDVQKLAPGQSPKIHASGDLDRDVKTAVAKGFRAIGHAPFNGELDGENGLIQQARNMGAVLVLLKSKQAEQMKPPLTPFAPGGPATAAAATGTSGNYANSSEIAVFFVKSVQKLKFGLFLSDLPAELRSKLGRNTGALVEVVRQNSPAAAANILPGDVVIEIADTPIRDGAHAAEIMRSTNPPDGRCTVKLLRNGAPRSVVLRFE